ncbi:MAG: ABC transporter ATP-binding protein [Alphaproteobacteria bacterium]|nr:ABC transporter ATP-binding protein [Alphaproteobacteria bacterium]
MLRKVTREFEQGGGKLTVLAGVDLTIQAGEIVALVGPSGAGKSTLLQIAGLLERPDTGEVIIDGYDCSALDDDMRTRLRRTSVGFVYQFHHLLPEFTALENVVLPQIIRGLPKDEARGRARELLGMVGLADRADHLPSRLSGGEQQRVAIVRAIANVPHVLLADEPTGNLDPHTAETVFASLKRIVRAAGLAALVATHNLDLAFRMDRVLEIKDGRVGER